MKDILIFERTATPSPTMETSARHTEGADIKKKETVKYGPTAIAVDKTFTLEGKQVKPSEEGEC